MPALTQKVPPSAYVSSANQCRGSDSSAIDGRTTRHAGYAVSQRIRKRIEEAFGWIKMVAGLEQTKFRGCDRVGLQLRRHRLQSDLAAEAVSTPAGRSQMSALTIATSR